jgi:hypothetical protein
MISCARLMENRGEKAREVREGCFADEINPYSLGSLDPIPLP